MAKAEWGAKRTCQNCGARFYDLRREPITCPACGAVYTGDQPSKLRRQASPAATARAPQPVAAPSPAPAADEEAVVEEVEDEDLEDIEEEEADEDVIEDASELEDEDDLAVAERLDGESEPL